MTRAHGYPCPLPLILRGSVLDMNHSHHYAIGQTGTGKTSFLKNQIARNITADVGFCFIDPHGDAANDALFLIPREKQDRAIYIDVADTAFPVGINPISAVPVDERALVTEEIVSAFIHLFGQNAIGPRSAQVLRNSVRTLLDYPNASLLQIPKLLTDQTFRKRTYGFVLEPSVLSYWRDQFDKYDDRFRTEVISPILNKLDAVFFSPALRNIIGQRKSTVDFRRAMDEGQFIIVNLAKGQIGEGPAHILGALIVSAITQAAFSRFDTSPDDRRPFCLIVDEFQNFTTDAFPTILSEARKYQLYLTLSHQFMSQLPEAIQDAILGNVSHMHVFRIGAKDAAILGRHIDFNPQALMDLPNHVAFERRIEAGSVSEARQKIQPHPPTPTITDAQVMLRHSRRKYGSLREKVENYIRRTLDS